MPKFRVTTTIETTQVVEATNEYQAAVLVGGNVTDVRPARGRQAASTVDPVPANVVTKVAKKRKPLSPEARARLAQNLVKARAARAQKHQTANKAVAKKTATKKVPAKRAATAKKVVAKKVPAKRATKKA